MRGRAKIGIISPSYPDLAKSSTLNVPQDNPLLLEIPIKLGKTGVDHKGGDDASILRRPGQFLSLHFPQNPTYVVNDPEFCDLLRFMVATVSGR